MQLRVAVNALMRYSLLHKLIQACHLFPNHDISSVFELKQNFAKYTFYSCMTLKLLIPILKLYVWRCDGFERLQMLTVINNYYGYMKYFKSGIFCIIPD